jgi:hypothetical protein
MTKVPTVRLENLTQDQIRAYIIADNRIAEKAGWDESILAIELQHLVTVDLGFDVTLTGFEIPEIDLILQQAEAKPEAHEGHQGRRRVGRSALQTCPSMDTSAGRDRFIIVNLRWRQGK